jgi:16S rRNA G966 N2-methylase RsmD
MVLDLFAGSARWGSRRQLGARLAVFEDTSRLGKAVIRQNLQNTGLASLPAVGNGGSGNLRGSSDRFDVALLEPAIQRELDEVLRCWPRECSQTASSSAKAIRRRAAAAGRRLSALPGLSV